MATQSGSELRQSFLQPLPDLELPPATYVKTHISGATTANTDPPRIMLLVEPQDWDRRGEVLVRAVNAARLRTHVPTRELPYRMHSEMDVVRAATLYLIHPIEIAINFKYPKQIYCQAEVASNGLRFDVAWRFRPDPANRDKFTTIAIFEFKKRGVINAAEWQSAKTDRQDVADRLEQAFKRREGTFFERNARPLSKQAAAYAISSKTRYVALFDWERLILLRFGGIVLTERSTSDEVDGCILPEDGREVKFRRALLGFLDEACEAKNVPRG